MEIIEKSMLFFCCDKQNNRSSNLQKHTMAGIPATTMDVTRTRRKLLHKEPRRACRLGPWAWPGPWPPGQALGLIAFALWGDGTWPWALAPWPGPGPNFHKFAQIPGSQPVVHSRILQKIGPPGPIFCKILLFTTFLLRLPTKT